MAQHQFRSAFIGQSRISREHLPSMLACDAFGRRVSKGAAMPSDRSIVRAWPEPPIPPWRRMSVLA
ncbi:hypothetical protein ACFU8I_04500 [Streptomyces sp. NPDC057540]|uniref:hypothetical protein n=1 Tax=Streptomyces sp. NPDC057540 TaxID=3346160 RepID=UPI0036BC0BE5